MDPVSYKYLKNINFKKEYDLKKSKILEYNEILNNFNYTVINGNNINNIPWYFTILTKTTNEKKRILKFCIKKILLLSIGQIFRKLIIIKEQKIFLIKLSAFHYEKSY